MERLDAEFRDTFREAEASLKSIGEGFHPLLPAVEPLLNLAVMPKTARLERVRTAFVLRQADKDGMVKHISGDRGDPLTWVNTEKREEDFARWRQAQQSPLRGQTDNSQHRKNGAARPASICARPSGSGKAPRREELERLGRFSPLPRCGPAA